jgi:hypothetical protein
MGISVVMADRSITLEEVVELVRMGLIHLIHLMAVLVN